VIVSNIKLTLTIWDATLLLKIHIEGFVDSENLNLSFQLRKAINADIE